MPNGAFSRLKKFYGEARALWEERAFEGEFQQSRFYKLLHFLVLVARSFVKNRCTTRASALAYTTLLALIPLLAVGLGVSTALLKKGGVEENQSIQHIINKFVDEVGPQLGLIPEMTDDLLTTTNEITVETTVDSTEITPEERAVALKAKQEDARRKVSQRISELINKARSGTLNVAGAIGLILVAVGLLSTIEATFNDIWGIARGRSWLTRLIYYWSVITFVPLLILLGMGLSISSKFQAAHDFVSHTPVIGALVFTIMPYMILVAVFMLIYTYMPNTRVRWKAALIGALVAALLWQLNSRFNIFFASKVVSMSRMFGGLSILPVFLIGLYFSWLIVLFGSQIAYAFQNREAYLQEKLAENVNQRGREFVALRLMTCIGQRFQQGQQPATVEEISKDLGVPSRLVQQVLQTLVAARLVIEIAGAEAFVPARPLEKINCHQILMAMRATHGQELVTRDEPCRVEVYGEFARIQEAERQAASSVNMLALVNRAQARLGIAPPPSDEMPRATVLPPPPSTPEQEPAPQTASASPPDISAQPAETNPPTEQQQPKRQKEESFPCYEHRRA